MTQRASLRPNSWLLPPSSSRKVARRENPQLRRRPLPEPPVHPPPRPHRRRWILAATAILLVGVYCVYRAVLRARVEAEYAKIRSEGFPVTGEELDAWYAMPEGENAANVYLQAFSKLDTKLEEDSPDYKLIPHFGYGEFPLAGDPISTEMIQAIDKFLKKNSEVMELLQNAAKFHGCRYPANLKVGLTVELPHLVMIRKTGQLMDLAVLSNVFKGNDDEAIHRLTDLVALARSLEQEPILLSQLVRIAVTEFVVDGAERIFSNGRLDDSRIQKLTEVFTQDETSEMFVRSLAGERCQVTILTQKALDIGAIFGPNANLGEWTLAAGYRLTGLMDLDQFEYASRMSELIRAARQSTHRERLKAAKGFGSRLPDVPSYCFLTRLILPALDGAILSDTRHACRLHLVQVAGAIERYRLAKGTVPADLSDLLPEFMPVVPEDPFTDPPAPPRYVRRTKGYVVYSVGENGVDDGGDKEDQKDVTFEVAR